MLTRASTCRFTGVSPRCRVSLVTALTVYSFRRCRSNLGSMTDDPRTDDPADDSRPFEIQVSERMKRLPAYLFARINQLTYQKRRAGDDVIDMSMGNPSDPPSDRVIEKLAEAARDPKNHGYSPSLGIMSLRREAGGEVSEEMGRAARSGKRDDRHARLEGRLQPHVPGPARAGRLGDRARPIVSCAYLRRRARLGQRDLARSGRQRKVPVEHRVHLPASLSQAEAGDPQLSAQSIDGDSRSGVLRRSGEAGAAVRLHDHQRPGLCRRDVRRLSNAELSGRRRARRSWPSSSRR